MKGPLEVGATYVTVSGLFILVLEASEDTAEAVVIYHEAMRPPYGVTITSGTVLSLEKDMTLWKAACLVASPSKEVDT